MCSGDDGEKAETISIYIHVRLQQILIWKPDKSRVQWQNVQGNLNLWYDWYCCPDDEIIFVFQLGSNDETEDVDGIISSEFGRWCGECTCSCAALESRCKNTIFWSFFFFFFNGCDPFRGICDIGSILRGILTYLVLRVSVTSESVTMLLTVADVFLIFLDFATVLDADNWVATAVIRSNSPFKWWLTDPSDPNQVTSSTIWS